MVTLFRNLGNRIQVDMEMDAAMLRDYFESERRSHLKYTSYASVFLGHIAPADSFLAKVNQL
jgi:hypothetical protein